MLKAILPAADGNGKPRLKAARSSTRNGRSLYEAKPKFYSPGARIKKGFET